MHRIEKDPIDPNDIPNKKYVDGKQVEISWAEYQNLSEEEKNNGTTYFVPDMPVSTSGEVIGDVEYGVFKLSSDVINVSAGLLNFNKISIGNLESTSNGIKLKKGKTYNIFCCVSFITNSIGDSHLLYDALFNGITLGETGVSLPVNSNNNTSDTPLNITFTPEEDGYLLITINRCNVADKIYSDYSRLTITEIPNYKGLIDVSDDHIKSLVPEGIKSNTSVNLKTLDNGYTSRIVEVDTGLILDYFKDDETNSDINRMYIGNDGKTLKLQKYSNGVLIDDYNLCKTKVDDVPVTEITLDETKFIKLASSSGIKYCVVNGICTIQTDGVGLINTGNITVCSGLPRPLLGIARGILQVEANSDNPTKPVYIQVVGDKLSLYSASSTGHFWGDLSYPIES